MKKQETLKHKQKRFDDLFKRIMKDLKINNATFIAMPDKQNGNMRVIMVEQEEADAYFKEVDIQIKKQITEQLESIGDPIAAKKDDKTKKDS